MKGEVLRKLRDLQAELNTGLPVPDDRLTVAAFLDRWLTASLPGQVSEKTFDSYADTVRLHIKPSMGRKVLRKLTVSDVDQLLASKRNDGYSANTVRIIRAVLRRALKQAEREGLVSRNVAALSAMATGSRTQDKVIRSLLRLVTVDEQGRPARWRVLRAELPAEMAVDLEPFVARRLLTTDTDNGETGATIEMAHEAFLTEWAPLAEAVTANALGTASSPSDRAGRPRMVERWTSPKSALGTRATCFRAK